MSGPFAGAVMTTFLAPAVTCLAASSRLVKSPVDSKTTSTPRSFHGSCAGSRSDSTLNSSPSTADAVASGLDARLQVAEHRVVLEQVGERLGAGQIVDRDEVDVLVAERRPHDVAADSTESVDADPDSHRSSSSCRTSSRIRRRRQLPVRRCGRANADSNERGCRRSNRAAILYSQRCTFSTAWPTLAVFIVVSPYFVYQAIRYKKYIGSLRQRLGFLPITFNVDGEESVWIHAVSVGEALTARALAADLKTLYPRLRLFLSTTTIAGQQVARQNLQHVDGVFYFPFDWTFIVRRTLDLVKPRVFIMMETEIWPNLLRICRKRGVKTIVINGRISSRSYPRYRLIRPFFRRVLADVDRFCMQSDESARRLIDLGADPSRVTVTGSLKFDSLQLPTASSHGKPRERVLRFFRMSPHRLVVVAGSTMRGEEAAVLRAFARVKATSPGALAILAPRQPERFGEVERLARDAGFVTVRRSDLPIDAEPRADVVVLDSIGELAQLYQVATAVFVGGSLADHGGHNILEPAIFGKPIVFGPHMQNFKEIADAFVANGAAVQVQSDRELEEALLALLTDPVRRARLGAAARALVEANRGAKDKTLAVIADLRRRRAPARSSVPSGACTDRVRWLNILSSIYGAAAASRRRWYRRDPAHRRRLRRPVISVGNLRVGGAGRRRSWPPSRGCSSSAASGRRSCRAATDAARRRTASPWCRTARRSSPASSRQATSR